MRSFEDAAAADFTERMTIHLRKIFPEQCSMLEVQMLRNLIQYGIERAESYEIVTERDVCLYLHVVISLGRDFDREIAWARSILDEVGAPSNKVRWIYERMAAECAVAEERRV